MFLRVIFVVIESNACHCQRKNKEEDKVMCNSTTQR